MTLILLGEAALRALALAVIVGAGLAIFRVRNPQVQLAVWRAVLVAALAMPILMQNVVITLPTKILPATTLPFVASSAEVTAIAPDVALPDPFLTSVNVEGSGGAHGASFAWSSVFFGLYAVVASALLLRLLVGGALTWRLLRGAYPLYARWTEGCEVRVSAALSAPVSVGSTILLPADYEEWSVEKRSAVLLHERAHVERGDFYTLLLAAVYRALFWFNPLSWWLHDKLAELAELASDAEAACALEQRTSYAEILLEFAAMPRTTIMAVAMARPNTIRRRIEHILQDDALPARVTRRVQAIVALAIIPLALAAAVSLIEAPAIAAVPVPLLPPAPIEDMVILTLQPTAKPLPPVSPTPVTPAAAAEPATPAAEDSVDKSSDRAARLQERIERQVQRDMERNMERSEKLSANIGKRVDAAERRAAATLNRLQPVSDRSAQETRTVDAFDSVAFSTSGALHITIGATRSVILEGNPDDLKEIETDVRGGMLNIRGKDGGYNRIGRVTAYVTVPSLKDVKVSGSGQVYLAGLKGGETNIGLSGSGSIEATGSLDKLGLKISGSGNANIPDLVVADADIKVSGSGNVTVQARKNLDVNISGSGKVRYVGNPRMNVHTSGSGSIQSLEDRSAALK